MTDPSNKSNNLNNIFSITDHFENCLLKRKRLSSDPKESCGCNPNHIENKDNCNNNIPDSGINYNNSLNNEKALNEKKEKVRSVSNSDFESESYLSFNYLSELGSEISENVQKFILYLPKIKTIKIKETYSSSVLFELPQIKRLFLKEKNKHVFAFNRQCGDFKLSYVVFLLNKAKNIFEFKKEFVVKEDSLTNKIQINNSIYNNDAQFEDSQEIQKNKLEFYPILVDELEENSLYVLRIFIKFGSYISSASDNFVIRTSYKKKTPPEQARVDYEVNDRIDSFDNNIFSMKNQDVESNKLTISVIQVGNYCNNTNNKYQELSETYLYTINRNALEYSREGNKENNNVNPALYITNDDNNNNDIMNNIKKEYCNTKYTLTKGIVYFNFHAKHKFLINSDSEIFSKDLCCRYNYNNQFNHDACFCCNDVDIENVGKNNSLQKKKENFENQDLFNLNNIDEPYNQIPQAIFRNFVSKNFSRIQLIKISTGLDFALALDSVGNAYSWGKNNYGQLGLNLGYTVLQTTPKPIEAFLCIKTVKCFVVDITTTDYSALALAVINGKQRLYTWGLGYGPEQGQMEDNSEFPEFRISYENSNIPIEYKNLVDNDAHRIIKILGNFNVFYVLIKMQKMNNLYSIGNAEIPNHIKSFKCPFITQGNTKQLIYRPTKAEFFEKNNLSIIECTIAQSYSVFIIENLKTNKKEVYFYGIISTFYSPDKEFDEQSYFDCCKKPKKIISDFFTQPYKVYSAKDYFLVLNNPSCNSNGNTEMQLYEVSINKNYLNRYANSRFFDYPGNNLNKDLFYIREIKNTNINLLLNKNIIYMHCGKDEINILMKQGK